MKLSYPALLNNPPIFHELSFEDIKKLCLNRFSNNERRKILLNNLKNMVIDVLEKENFSCNIWIDGSFSTIKEEPDDIDLVIEFPSFLDNKEKYDNFLNMLSKIFGRIIGISDDLPSFQREFHDKFHLDLYWFPKGHKIYDY